MNIRPKFIGALAVVTMLMSSAPVAASDSKTAEQIINRFMSQEGFQGDYSEKSIVFKYQGKKIVFNRSNPKGLLQLSLLFGDVDDSNREKILELCNTFNNRKGALKFSVLNDSVYINYETFTKFNPPNRVLTSNISQMAKSFEEFVQELDK